MHITFCGLLCRTWGNHILRLNVVGGVGMYGVDRMPWRGGGAQFSVIFLTHCLNEEF